MTEHGTDCEPLLALATPQFYQRNLFRVLDLPISATAKDVQRQQNRRKMQQKLGIVSTKDQGGLFPLDPPPSEEDIRAAMERLNEPVARLLDEALWFWPANGHAVTDPALKALGQGETEKATALWKEQTKRNGQAQIAIHNLAVLDHLVALDHEADLATQKPPEKHLEELTDRWQRVYSHWKQVIDGEEFWSVVKDRIRDLNDMQLTTGFARRIRATLPKALLLINARIALSAAERGDTALAERHIKFINQADFGNDFAKDAIREAIKPVRNRIKTATQKAKDQWTNIPQHGNRDVRELFGQTEGLLAIVDAILPEEDLSRGSLHDMVAEAMLEGQIAFSNKTNDWAEGVNLLEIAQKLAAGDSLRTRILENIAILKENVKTGNEWCIPGYWDLPEKNIEDLEAARQKKQAGDYDGAIQTLIVLDPQLGRPLRRCLANTLSLKGIGIINNALTEYNTETSILKKIIDNILKYKNSPSLEPSRWGYFPNPNTPSYMLPPCLCCEGTYYTSWTNFTFKDIKLFMCSSCSEKNDREVEQQKSVLRKHTETSLEYLLLADEVDPGDVGVQRNLKTVKGTAIDINCSIPKTKKLKKNLGTDLIRCTPYTPEFTDEDHVCHFCRENPADDSCGILIAMCGDLQQSDGLIGKVTEYRYTDVVIPRCRRCRDEHRELPGRIEKWHEAKSATADIEHFPELVRELESAETAVHQAQECVGEHNKKVTEIQSEIEQAEAIGSHCDKCNSEKFWKNFLCRRCDQKAFEMGAFTNFAVGMAFILPVAVILVILYKFNMLSLLTEFVAAQKKSGAALLSYLPVVAVPTIPLSIGSILAYLLTRDKRSRRRELSQQRQAEISERRDTEVAKAKAKAAQTASALKSVEDDLRKQQEVYKQAKGALELKKENAAAEFVKNNPEPELTTDVTPESTYSNFFRITDFRKQGWAFGRALHDGKLPLNYPMNPRGIVGREPRLIKGSGISEPSSSKPAIGRDRLKEIAKLAGENEMTECSICSAQLKAKNLVHHYDKQHEGHYDKQHDTTSKIRGKNSEPTSTKNSIGTIPPSHDITNRTLCINGECIGVVGSDGRCSECGTWHPDFS